jgi:ACS family hexuronate transporter-like MFS transporter
MNQQAIGKYRWTICTLLFFATTVNYLDRQVLSLLAPDLSKQFGWTNSDYANITAVFQFVYAISMLFAGRVIDKLGTKAAFLLAIFIWSLGAILHAFSISVGEGVNTIFASIGLAAVPVSIAGFMVGAPCWRSARRATSRPRSRPPPNTSPSASVPSPPASSIPAPTSARSWRR